MKNGKLLTQTRRGKEHRTEGVVKEKRETTFRENNRIIEEQLLEPWSQITTRTTMERDEAKKQSMCYGPVSRQALADIKHFSDVDDDSMQELFGVEVEVVEDYFFPQRPVKAGELFPFEVAPAMLGKSAVLLVSGAC